MTQNFWKKDSPNLILLLGVEWTLYEQVAIAALDCQAIDVAKVQLTLLWLTT